MKAMPRTLPTEAMRRTIGIAWILAVVTGVLVFPRVSGAAGRMASPLASETEFGGRAAFVTGADSRLLAGRWWKAALGRGAVALAARVIGVGTTVHVAPAGAPEQVSVTGPAKPSMDCRLS